MIKEPSCIPDFSLGLPNGGAFEPTRVKHIPTIMDRLDNAGMTWKIYGATKGEGAYGEFDICPTFADCLYTKQDKDLVPDKRFIRCCDGAAFRPSRLSRPVALPSGVLSQQAEHDQM